MPKFEIRRSCGCKEKVKVYPADAKRQENILAKESLKVCKYHTKEAQKA